MGISVGGGSGGGTLDVLSNHIFADDTARDAYFVSNPSERVLGLSVVSNSLLQKWNGSMWVNITPIIRGPQGDSGVVNLTPTDIETLYELNLNTNKFTDAEKTKLSNVTDNFKGLYADAAARDVGIPSPISGNYIIQNDTDTVWFYDGILWVNTGATSSGDMLQVVYDPSSKAVNVYNVDNHETGSVNAVYSIVEKNKLNGVAANATANSADSFLLDRANHTGNIDLGTF